MQPSATLPLFRRNTTIEEQVCANWPFSVVASVGGIDLPQDFVGQLRSQFLAPIAESPFADRIARVEVTALSAEYDQWTCVIHLKDGEQPVRLEDYASFYNGRTPSPYAAAVRCVLGELQRITKRVRSNEGE